MIIVTGTAGFIGSCLVARLNEMGHHNIVMVDDFGIKGKQQNFEAKQFIKKLHRNDLMNWLDQYGDEVTIVFHLGARTNTAEFDKKLLWRLNVTYSKNLWEKCTAYKIPMIYASSAATYGLGENAYKDDHNIIKKLKPLNPYGESKNEFDKWVLTRDECPPFWAGLKFFNVYGPNEYHKERMASVIFHAYQQIKTSGTLKLFKSHRTDYEDGHQKRDFIYVKDVVDVCYYIMQNRIISGIYNLGTGKARTFLDIAKAVFKSLNLPQHIEFIDTPIDIRNKYQYFTEADMDKLRKAGYQKKFMELEDGVGAYVREYLDNQGAFY